VPLAGRSFSNCPHEPQRIVDLATLRKAPKNSAKHSKMAAPPSAYKDRQFLAVIGDEVRIYLLDIAGTAC